MRDSDVQYYTKFLPISQNNFCDYVQTAVSCKSRKRPFEV